MWRCLGRRFAVYENKLVIDNAFKSSTTTEWISVKNPATQEVVARVPQVTSDEFNQAVASAKTAFQTWRDVPVLQRLRVLNKLRNLIDVHTEELAHIITRENGKTLADARGDVFRGLEVVEHCQSFGSLLQGETMGQIAKDMDLYSYREPLGVCAGIAPFNFPAMIPLWMFPVSAACGNTYVMKPSEKVPSTLARIVELAIEAGFPPGVVNVVHGGKKTVDFICDHPDIKAISFVGSNHVGEYIYTRGSAKGKRVQSNMGAKNHAIVLPDANKEDALNALVGATFGAAGQRCMALSVVVLVGEAQNWVGEIVEKAKTLKVGPGDKEGVDISPLNTEEAKTRVVDLITRGEREGAKLLLDGRSITVPGFERGNFIGPTVFDHVNPTHSVYSNEIFGPVLCIVRSDSLQDAIDFINRNAWGNGVSIFTRCGNSARKFQREIECGQVGINVPIPVPLPMFSFTGNKASIRGDLNFYGKGGVQFFTQWKTITSRWKDEGDSYKLSTAFPTMR